ncbi:MAG: hypothetical protein [Cotesia congregata filamentous virus 2]
MNDYINVFDKIQKYHRTLSQSSKYEILLYMLVKGILTNTFEFKNDKLQISQHFKRFQLLNFYFTTYKPNKIYYKPFRFYENYPLKQLKYNVHKLRGLFVKKILLLRLLQLKKNNIRTKISKYIKIIHHKSLTLQKLSIVDKIYDELFKFQNFTNEYKDSLKIQVRRFQEIGEKSEDINHELILNPILRPFSHNIVIVHDIRPSSPQPQQSQQQPELIIIDDD